MRLYIRLSKNKETIPFNYQHLLTGVIHKWIGENNEEHGSRSLFSFSWLQNTQSNKKGIMLNSESYFFISAYDTNLLKKIMKGILEDPALFCGSKVVDVQIKEIPKFSTRETFFVNSPILIRRKDGERIKHVVYLDDEFEILLTENLKGKLEHAGIPSIGISVEVDREYPFSQTKLVNYKGIKNRVSLAPVIIKGTPEQIAFAWQVGLGNSTGIGFGSLK